MITIVKPIPYLHTTARNEITYAKSHLQSTLKLKDPNKEDSYRWPPTSCLQSFCKTSISIRAASRYLCIDRTIFIATISFFSLSKHSKTFPKVPAI